MNNYSDYVRERIQKAGLDWGVEFIYQIALDMPCDDSSDTSEEDIKIEIKKALRDIITAFGGTV